MDYKDFIIAEQARIIKEQAQMIDALKAEIVVLKQRINDLERRLKLDSSTSSKPPSSDGLRKKPSPVSLRTQSQNSSGGQPGHKGSTRLQRANPDKIIRYTVSRCIGCNADLHGVREKHTIKRQVLDIPLPQIEVTEHQAEVKICSCGTKNIAQFPVDVTAPVQYGKNIQSYVVYLQSQQFIPENRVQMLLKDFFNVEISQGTLATCASNFANQLSSVQSELKNYLNQAPVKNLDETGYSIAAKTHWLHVLSNSNATLYRTSTKRSSLPEDLSGTVVHDHFKPYFRLTGVDHALCNAHHLRELKAVAELDKEVWAKQLIRLLLCAHHLSKSTSDKLTPEKKQRVSLLYDTIITKGLEYHENLKPLMQASRGRRKRRTAHNLLIRLQKFKIETLLFLTNNLIPFTNNQAEQDLRMMKVKQKISGGFRTLEGASSFCTIRSFLNTARKQGKNIMEAIVAALHGQFDLNLA